MDSDILLCHSQKMAKKLFILKLRHIPKNEMTVLPHSDRQDGNH